MEFGVIGALTESKEETLAVLGTTVVPRTNQLHSILHTMTNKFQINASAASVTLLMGCEKAWVGKDAGEDKIAGLDSDRDEEHC